MAQARPQRWGLEKYSRVFRKVPIVLVNKYLICKSQFIIGNFTNLQRSSLKNVAVGCKYIFVVMGLTENKQGIDRRSCRLRTRGSHGVWCATPNRVSARFSQKTISGFLDNQMLVTGIVAGRVLVLKWRV